MRGATRTIGHHWGIAVFTMLAVILSLMALPAMAWAEDNESPEPTEQFEEGDSQEETDEEAEATQDAESEEEEPATSNPAGGIPLTGDDYVWFGKDLALNEGTVANDLIAAGQTLQLENLAVAGSVRVAAQIINIDDSFVSKNITAAGQDVTIRDTDAVAISAAGQTVTFSGECESFTAGAGKVVIDGTITGDASVQADYVEIGAHANIQGTLYVSASSSPVTHADAVVGNIEYTQIEDATRDAEAVASGISSAFSFLTIAASIVCTPVIAMLAEWLFRRHTAAAADMIRTRTGATIGSGVVGTLVAPIAFILLLFLVVTIPVAIGLGLSLIAMAVFAAGFMGASIFRLLFPNLGRFTSALAGGAIMGVAGAIPVLGTVTRALAFIYLLGYVLQSIYLGLRKNPAQKSELPKQPDLPTPPTIDEEM